MTDRIELTKDSPVVQNALARWNGDAGSCQRISSGVSAVFRLESAGAGRYLRLLPGTSHDRLAAALEFQLHLWRQGVPVCEPAFSRSGRLVERIGDEDSAWAAAATVEEAGSTLDEMTWTPEICYEWGRSLGELHLAAESYCARAGSQFDAWERAWRDLKQEIDPNDALAATTYQRLDAWLGTLPPPEGNADFGLTHADFRSGNLLWNGLKVVVTDFGEPRRGWYAMDIARVWVDFLRFPAEERARFRETFLRGYRSVRPFSGFWQQSLGELTTLVALNLYTWFGCFRTGTLVAHRSGAGETDAPLCGLLRHHLAGME